MAALPAEGVVAVIGAGAMGSGIAQTAAQAGHPVRLFDTRMGAADDARKRIAATFDTLAAKGKMTAEAAKAAAGRIAAVHALGDCVSAALVVEAVIEDLGAKRKLLQELEVVVPPATILASNTSSLSVTALAAGMKHPGRVVGMHFFNPVPLMPLVEVVSGLATERAVADTIYATSKAWGKIPVHATSTPGFIVNRCARSFYAEGLRLLAERAADPATLDAVMREAGGFRMGPFELMDLIGHDVNLAVTKSVWEMYFHDPRFTPSVIQQELVAAGYLGRKSGRGFYDYAEGAPRPAPQTEAPCPAPRRVRVHGEAGLAAPLVARIAAAGVAVETIAAHPAFPDGALAIDGAFVAPTDGRPATLRAQDAGIADLVLFDLALDYATCARLAIAVADGAAPAAVAAATGALQAAGLAVSRLDDAAGLAVMRTVATLANEAADAAQQGIATAADIDVAMQRGVNYPRGPLAWADAVGVARIRTVLAQLGAHYGEDRYRISPWIARRAARGASLLS